MSTGRKWQMVAVAGLMLASAWVGQARADYVFGTPKNLGPQVNSSDNEYDPALSADDLTLYFNSDRPGGFGGHDLYMTMRESREAPWGEPVNLGPVVNSEFSEINPNISHDGLSLYFADVEGDTVAPRPGGPGERDAGQ
jgi:Tol biopolymer transport system component